MDDSDILMTQGDEANKFDWKFKTSTVCKNALTHEVTYPDDVDNIIDSNHGEPTIEETGDDYVLVFSFRVSDRGDAARARTQTRNIIVTFKS